MYVLSLFYGANLISEREKKWRLFNFDEKVYLQSIFFYFSFSFNLIFILRKWWRARIESYRWKYLHWQQKINYWKKNTIELQVLLLVFRDRVLLLDSFTLIFKPVKCVIMSTQTVSLDYVIGEIYRVHK